MEIDTTKSITKQFPRNLAANVVYFLVNVIVGLLLVPFFISTLGVAAYGLIPLATSVTGYVAIVVQSLNTAVTRFLTVDLQREDYAGANRTFNTAFFGLTAVILLMVPIVMVVAYLIPVIFSVAPGQEQGAIFLFLGVCAAFLLRSWSGNFTVQLFAYNRLDLQNLVNLTNLVLQTGLIVLLFVLLGPDLALVGGAYFAGAVAASVVSIILARRVCPHLKVSIHAFDRSLVRDLCGMGGWLVIDQIGALLLFQLDLVVVNLLFGATMAGEYAIALQWRILLHSIVGMLTGILVPTVLVYYAQKQTDTLIKITKSAVKLLGLAIALPAGLICGFSPQLLTIWVGTEYASLAPLLVLLTAPFAATMSVQPLFSINVAHNRVRVPGTMTILLGIANLALAIIIPLITGWGYYGVAVAGAIILTFRHTLFVPWYTAKILKSRMIDYQKCIFPGAFALFIIGVAAASLVAVTSFSSILAIIIAGIGVTLVYGIVVLEMGLTSFEKQLFRSYLPQRWKKIGN